MRKKAFGGDDVVGLNGKNSNPFMERIGHGGLALVNENNDISFIKKKLMKSSRTPLLLPNIDLSFP